jgi:hypothetical protein
VAIDAPAELDVHEQALKERVQVAHCLGIVETHACRGVVDGTRRVVRFQCGYGRRRFKGGLACGRHHRLEIELVLTQLLLIELLLIEL